MKRTTSLILILSVASLAANGQTQPQSQPEGAGNSLPPGLEKRGQLPPGLQGREELPPGLQRRQGQAAGGTNFNAGQPLPRVGQAAQPGLTNQVPWGNTLPRTGLMTNRNYATNFTATNRTSLTIQDQAFTPADRQVLIQGRRAVQPILSTVATEAQGRNDAWMPVHFVVRDRVVEVVGVVQSTEQIQQIELALSRVPGVARVVNRLEIKGDSEVEAAVGGSSAQLAGEEAGAGVGYASTNILRGTNGMPPVQNLTNRLAQTNNLGRPVPLPPTGRTNLPGRVHRPGQGEMELPPSPEDRGPQPPVLNERLDSRTPGSDALNL